MAHGNIHSDNTSHSANPKSTDRPKFFARRNVTLRNLLQAGITAESNGRVGSLTQRGGQEALEEASDAFFARDDRGSVEEALHSGVCGFSVVDAVLLWSVGVYFSGTKHSLENHNVYICVFILSNGVTASRDSVTPVPRPASTVAGPDIFPSASRRYEV